MLRQALSILEALSGSPQAREAAMALLETERLVSEGGATTELWRDVWQGPWRRCVSRWLPALPALHGLPALHAHPCLPWHSLVPLKDSPC